MSDLIFDITDLVKDLLSNNFRLRWLQTIRVQFILNSDRYAMLLLCQVDWEYTIDL